MEQRPTDTPSKCPAITPQRIRGNTSPRTTFAKPPPITPTESKEILPTDTPAKGPPNAPQENSKNNSHESPSQKTTNNSPRNPTDYSLHDIPCNKSSTNRIAGFQKCVHTNTPATTQPVPPHETQSKLSAHDLQNPCESLCANPAKTWDTQGTSKGPQGTPRHPRGARIQGN